MRYCKRRIPKCNVLDIRNAIVEQRNLPNQFIHGCHIPPHIAKAILALYDREDELIRTQRGLVYRTVSRQYKSDSNNEVFIGNTFVSMNDLLAEGYIALIRSAYTFNPQKGSWSTYAVRVIQHGIWKHLANNVRYFSIPRYIWCIISKVRRLEQKHPEKSIEELIATLSLSKKVVKRVLDYLRINEWGDTDNVMQRNSSNAAIRELQLLQKQLCKLNLSDLEIRVAQRMFNDGDERGWQVEFARNTINPQTGRPYTRQNISLITQKIRRVLKEVA